MATLTTDKATAKPSAKLTPDQLWKMLKDMLLIRRFEEKTQLSYQQTKIGGFCHIYIGQEACAVGSISATRHTDPIITAYRDHAHALARGTPPKYAMAEMYGKVTGSAKGKGGSMHFFDKPNHMYGGHAIVGGQCPLGVGLAFASAYLGKDEVTLCYFGDGALNQGAFHEAMNLAAIWRLPIIFVLENNGYSMGTAIERGTAAANDMGAKAKAYGMQYRECDGMDVLATYDCFKPLIDSMRGSTSKNLGTTKDKETGTGPAFVNVKTYRFVGHSMSDPQKYRTKDEVDQMKQRDPIATLVNHVVDRKLFTQADIDKLDAEMKALAADAVKFAEESPETPISELYTDVYSQPYEGGPYKIGDLPDMLK